MTVMRTRAAILLKDTIANSKLSSALLEVDNCEGLDFLTDAPAFLAKGDLAVVLL